MFNLAWFCSCFLNAAMCDSARRCSHRSAPQPCFCIRVLGESRDEDVMIGSDDLMVDLFAGGGGASTGVEAAIRRPVDIAVNHDEAAIAMHQRNHPETRHYREDVFAVDPRAACRGSRRVAGLWMSPDCNGFGKARETAAKKRFAPWLTWAFVGPNFRVTNDHA